MVKCGLAQADGQVTVAARPLAAAVSGAGRHEVAPAAWVRAIAACVRDLGLPRKLAAVVVTGNGPTVVPAAADATPLGHAVTWLDQRSTAESRLIAERTGREREAGFFLGKIFWFYRHAPQLYRQTHGFLSGPEFIELRLTGHWHTNLPAPAFQRFYWDADTVEALGMDPAKLPPFIATGSALGGTSAQAEREMGIPAGVPVIAGAPDFVMAMLGTGAVAAGDTCNRSGTSDGINYCSPRAVDDQRLLCLPHIVDGLYTVSGVISTTGKALEWFAHLVGRDPTLFERAAQAAPGAGGVLFLPYLAGERTPLWRDDVRGVFSGLALEHGRVELARAVLEAVGYTLRDSVTLIEANGGAVNEIRLAGAGAYTRWLNQIKADILGRRLLVPAVADAELTGCACVGLHALGVEPTLAAAARRLVRVVEVIEPQPQHAALYREGFARFKREQARL